MFGFLIPKEFGFFDVFDQHAATCVEGSQILIDMLEHFGDAPAKTRRLKDVEHKADEITHHTVEMLHKTFVTPIDREDILKSCIEINKLENDGDAIRDAAMAKLFKEEKNAVQVLVWKEIYETIETAIDKCEDVANVIEGVVLENA